MTIQEKFSKALLQSWESFKLEHPHQAWDIELHFAEGSVVVGLQQELEKDEAYRALLAQTDAEADVATIIVALMPLVESVIGKILL